MRVFVWSETETEQPRIWSGVVEVVVILIDVIFYNESHSYYITHCVMVEVGNRIGKSFTTIEFHFCTCLSHTFMIPPNYPPHIYYLLSFFFVSVSNITCSNVFWGREKNKRKETTRDNTGERTGGERLVQQQQRQIGFFFQMKVL